MHLCFSDIVNLASQTCSTFLLPQLHDLLWLISLEIINKLLDNRLNNTKIDILRVFVRESNQDNVWNPGIQPATSI